MSTRIKENTHALRSCKTSIVINHTVSAWHVLHSWLMYTLIHSKDAWTTLHSVTKWKMSTLVSHNIKTTCLILYRSPSWHQHSSDPLSHALKVSWGICHQDISSRFFEAKSSKLQVGLHVLDLFVQHTDAQLYWDLGSYQVKWTPWTLFHVPQTTPEQFF